MFEAFTRRRAVRLTIAALLVLTGCDTDSIVPASQKPALPEPVVPRTETGAIDLAISTQGPDTLAPASYTIKLTTGQTLKAPVNGVVQVTGVTAGVVTIVIDDVPEACWVSGSRKIDTQVYANRVTYASFSVFCIQVGFGTGLNLPIGVWDAVSWEFSTTPDFSHQADEMISSGLSGTLTVTPSASAPVTDNVTDWRWRETYRWWGPDRPTVFQGHAWVDDKFVRASVTDVQTEFECDWGDCNGPLYDRSRLSLSGDTLVILHDGPVSYYNFSSVVAWSRLMLIRRQ
jgi:hypothetical protein